MYNHLVVFLTSIVLLLSSLDGKIEAAPSVRIAGDGPPLIQKLLTAKGALDVELPQNGASPIARPRQGSSLPFTHSGDRMPQSMAGDPDDAYWMGGFGDLESVYQPGLVYSLATYNNQLIAGGRFDSAGGVPVSNVAAWDGTQWLPLDTGVDLEAVFNLVEFGGLLYASGYGGLASWDGSAWSPVPFAPQNVVGMVVHDTELICGGAWFSDSGTATFAVVAWNGTTWRGLGTCNDWVFDLLVWRDTLYACGRFTSIEAANSPHIARWNGYQWSSVGSGLGDITRRLFVYNDALIAGGLFTQAGGNPAEHVARWDGNAWSALGDGLNGYVRSFALYDGTLVAGGTFTRSGLDTLSYIGAWNGSQWVSVGGGFDRTAGTLLPIGDELIAGGSMRSAGSSVLSGIARWDRTSWQTMGAGFRYEQLGGFAYVWSILPYGDKLIVTGEFFGVPGQPEAMNIAAWDSVLGWSCLGTGLNGAGRALAVYDGKLFVAGDFSSAGDVPVPSLAVWDGTTWSAVPGDVLPLPYSTGIDALWVFDNKLIVGNLQWAGGIPINGVGAWDGSGWTSLGLSQGYIDNFTTYQGELISTGSQGVRRWDGSAWNDLYGFWQQGICLYVYHDTLLSGGFSSLQVWNGTLWTPYAGGVDGMIVQLDENQGQLVVGGDFSEAGGVPANNIATYDGTQWSPLGSGTNGPVFATGTFASRLWVGGNFTTAGNKANSTLACWTKNTDLDDDGFPNNTDNCPDTYNPEQTDSDQDGIGDACCCGFFSQLRGDMALGRDGITDGSDLQTCIDYVFFNDLSTLYLCLDAQDVNNDATFDGGDLGILVDYIFFNDTSTITRCDGSPF